MAGRLVDPADAAIAATDHAAGAQRQNISRDLGYIGHLVVLYLKSDPKMGIALIALRVAIIVGSTVNLLYFQINLASATNAIVANDAATVWSALSFAVLQIVVMFVIAIGGVFAEYALRIRMRGVYTNNLLGRWLAGNKFYELERLGGIDHPEQRIQEDIYVYVQLFITLAPTLLSTVMNVFLYSGTLWSLSAPVSLEAIGLPITIQGYLPFLAIGLGLLMTLIVHFVGIPLTKAEITRQRLEAHFRNDMGGVRENAEAVAFEKGGGIENARLREVFDLIRQNWRRFTLAQARLQAVIGLPPVLLIIAPMALCAPLIMAGKMGMGDMQLVSSSFMMVYGSVSIIASSYSDVAILRSAVARMRLLDEALSRPSQSGIEVADGHQASITTRDLHLRFPDDRSMLRIGQIELARGDRLLIRGRSGAGKSTLLRALAGLWPYGSGAVALPRDARVCFLPQRSYMPDGTLSALLSYPNAPDPARETEYRNVLQSLELDALIPRLHHHEQWRRKLSPGEQQRVAAARALLSRPDFLFLDEATSALDPRSETNLYTLLDEQLPSAAIISIAHRPDVARFHRDVLEIENGSASIGTLPPQKVTA